MAHRGTTPGHGSGPHLDLCHSTRNDGLGLTTGIQFAEPDFEQQWVTDSPDRAAAKAFRRLRRPTHVNGLKQSIHASPSPSPYTWNWYKDRRMISSTPRNSRSDRAG